MSQNQTNNAAPFRCALTAVDIAVVRPGAVLLGRKKNSTRWCFPGGFVDHTKDANVQAAARRELQEEAPGCPIHAELTFLDGPQIADPRYANDKDRIFSMLFLARYKTTARWTPKSADDLEEVAWFALSRDALAFARFITKDTLVPWHRPLLATLRKHLAISDLKQRVQANLKQQLQGANDALERINSICDGAGIPRTDGDRPSLEVSFCEAHRVKLLAQRLADIKAARK